MASNGSLREADVNKCSYKHLRRHKRSRRSGNADAVTHHVNPLITLMTAGVRQVEFKRSSASRKNQEHASYPIYRYVYLHSRKTSHSAASSALIFGIGDCMFDL